MAMSILFPDGTIRDVPGQLVIRSTASGEAPRFVQIPVNCDPLWRYRFVDGRWRALARHDGKVAILNPGQREWWHAIAQMQEQASEPESHVA
jgi:hypothetical protein